MVICLADMRAASSTNLPLIEFSVEYLKYQSKISLIVCSYHCFSVVSLCIWMNEIEMKV